MGIRSWLADRAAWNEYGAKLTEMDRQLEQLETAGKVGTPEFDEAWHDRMGFAANCYPGAPDRVPLTEAEMAEIDRETRLDLEACDHQDAETAQYEAACTEAEQQFADYWGGTGPDYEAAVNEHYAAHPEPEPEQ